MQCGTVYAYGTTIRVWYRKTYHTRMVRTVRVRYVPYAYGMKYAYGTQHFQKHFCSVVLVTIETLSVRYYVARLDTVLEAKKESWRQC